MGASGSSPSHLPSWPPAKRPLPSHPNTRYCLGTHVTLTEETGVVSPPPHAWTAPLVEDMLCYAITGLSKAMVMGPGRAILFYERQSLGEGLSLGRSRDTTIILMGWAFGSVNQPILLHPLTIQKGPWEIAQAITECWIKARSPGCPRVNPLTPQPFKFDLLGDSSQKDTPGDANSDHQLLHHWPQRGQNHNQCRRDQGLPPPQLPSPSPDCRFESYRSSVLTASSMSSLSDRSEGSWHSQQGRHHGETRALMKNNLPIFKDEDAKDAVTYQSWRWDLMLYHCVECRDCSLLPYAIQSLQGYPGELVQSSGMDITLDDALTILDENYNNVKALDVLNQELFQLWMVEKETVLDWGICLLRHLQVLAASFPDHFPPDHVAKLK